MRQYFTAQQVDPLIVAASITPTTVFTALFTANQAQLYFPIGTGASAPSAGQVFRFSVGGLITTPATGTLVITPIMGLTVAGTSLGASAAQTVTASLANTPWRIDGELVFRSVSPTATTSTAWCTGTFAGQGTLATAGGGWGIQFGSTAAVNVDTTGAGSANTFGALNFGFTFSVTGATVSAQYSSFQSLN